MLDTLPLFRKKVCYIISVCQVFHVKYKTNIFFSRHFIIVRIMDMDISSVTTFLHNVHCMLILYYSLVLHYYIYRCLHHIMVFIFISATWATVNVIFSYLQAMVHSKQYRFLRRNPWVLLPGNPWRTPAGFSWSCMVIVLRVSFQITHIV